MSKVIFPGGTDFDDRTAIIRESVDSQEAIYQTVRMNSTVALICLQCVIKDPFWTGTEGHRAENKGCWEHLEG